MEFIGEKFVQEFVIGFGFLNGLLIQTLIDAIAELDPEMAGWLAVIFGIISISIIVVMLFVAYSLGGIIGLIAILLEVYSITAPPAPQQLHPSWMHQSHITLRYFL
jgi:hypothetical protein